MSMSLRFFKTLFLTSIGLAIVITTAFQSCAEQSSFSSNEAYRSPFADRRVILNKKSFAVSSDGVEKTKPGLELTIVVNNDCAETFCANTAKNKDSFVCPVFAAHRHRDLKEQAYDIRLDGEYTYEEAEKRLGQAQADQACVRGYTEKQTYKISALNAADFTDPMYTQQSHLDLINWNKSIANLSYSAAIGIVDTGIPAAFVPGGTTFSPTSDAVPLLHEDLRENFSQKFTKGCDTVEPGKTVYCPNHTFRPDGTSHTCNPHGLYIAGVIAAIPNNNKGIVGIHPWSTIYSTIVGDCAGNITSAEIANSIKFLILRQVRVINISIGGSDDSDATIEDAINQALSASIVVVVAGGNSGKDLRINPVYPAAYAKTKPGLISVGWGDKTASQLHPDASYSPEHIKVAAPGTEILTLAFTPATQRSEYVRPSGSSLAAPIVTAAIGKMIAYLEANKIYADPATIEKYLIDYGSKTIPTLAAKVQEGRYLDMVQMKAAADRLINDYKVPPVGIVKYELRTEGASTFIDIYLATDPLSATDMGRNPRLAVFDGYIGAARFIGTPTQLEDGRNYIKITLNRSEFVVVDNQLIFSIGYYKTVTQTDASTVQEWVSLASVTLKKDDLVFADAATSPIMGAVLGSQLISKGALRYLQIEGWACQKQFSRPLNVELWINGSKFTADTARLEGRRGVYENCESLSIDHGFIFEIPLGNFSNVPYEVRILHPTNPTITISLNKSLLSGEDLRTPYYESPLTVSFFPATKSRNADVVNLGGYLCSSSRGSLRMRFAPDYKHLVKLILFDREPTYSSFYKEGFSLVMRSRPVPAAPGFTALTEAFDSRSEVGLFSPTPVSKRAYLSPITLISGSSTEYPEKSYITISDDYTGEWPFLGWSTEVLVPTGTCSTLPATPYRFDYNTTSPAMLNLLPGYKIEFTKAYLTGTTTPPFPPTRTNAEALARVRYWVDVQQDGFTVRNAYAFDP